MGYEPRDSKQVACVQIENAADAQELANSSFERLAALENEIEKALAEIKKMNGMEKFSTEEIRSSLGKGLGIGALGSSALGVAAILGSPLIGLPLFWGGSLFGNFLGGGSSKALKALAENQNMLYENMIKISRVQVMLFEFQRVTVEILNELFDMCSSNIEVVQSTIETLKERLSGSESSMSDSTKKDVRDLIRKLMARKDTLMKQNDMEQEIKQLKNENKEIKQMLENLVKNQ